MDEILFTVIRMLRLHDKLIAREKNTDYEEATDTRLPLLLIILVNAAA